MQILLTEAAYRRRGGDLRALRPDADFVQVTGPDGFAIDGRPVAADGVAPEVIWLSYDTWQTGLLPTLLSVAERRPPKWLQAHSAGLDWPMFKPIMASGARVTKNAGQAVAMSEYVLAHALSLMVPVDAQRQAQAEHRWAQIPYREVSRSRWGILGWGEIGHEVAKRALAFGAQVTAVRRSPGEDPLVGRTYGVADLPQLLPELDVVVLVIPATAETRGLADAAFFAAMKPGSILINVARGALIDTEALKAGLEQDRPAHAVLDVFDPEPLPADSWMWDHPKVRVTAHTSWNGDGYGDRMDARFVENFRRYLAGEPLLNEATPREAGA